MSNFSPKSKQVLLQCCGAGAGLFGLSRSWWNTENTPALEYEKEADEDEDHDKDKEDDDEDKEEEKEDNEEDDEEEDDEEDEDDDDEEDDDDKGQRGRRGGGWEVGGQRGRPEWGLRGRGRPR